MSESATETLVDVFMPQMGVSVTEGTLIAWTRQVGDAIGKDETLCEISTDKVDTDVPSPVSGTLAEILIGPDDTVPVGTLIARVATSDPPAEPESPATAEPQSPAAAAPPPPPPATDGPGSSGQRYSPVVSRMAEAHDIDLSAIAGSGRNGRVTKRDVLAYLERPATRRSEPAPAPGVPEPGPSPAGATTLSRMRRQIAENMRRSVDTAAHCHTWIEVDMGAVETTRRAAGLTALPFVAHAAVDALRSHPMLNGWLEGETRTILDEVHLGIAVSLGEEGLVVPVIRDAQDLAPAAIAARIEDLAGRARSRRLTPDEVGGATFTITNPGRYGSLMSAPIIDVPQVAILGLEGIVKRPVVVQDADGNDAIAIRPTSVLGLGWDHRALDGALAAQFLSTLKQRLERLTGTG